VGSLGAGDEGNDEEAVSTTTDLPGTVEWLSLDLKMETQSLLRPRASDPLRLF